MAVTAKICGLNEPDAVAAAVAGGADQVGLVFYPPSPRYVTPATAAALAEGVPPGVSRVGLFVDASDDDLAAAFAQLGLRRGAGPGVAMKGPGLGDQGTPGVGLAGRCGAARETRDQGVLEGLVVVQAQGGLDLVEADGRPHGRRGQGQSQRFSHRSVTLLSAVRPCRVTTRLLSR